MTLDEMRAKLEWLRLPSGGALMRVTTGSGFYEAADHDLVMAAFTEIERKVPIVMAGADEFTSVEKLLFQMLTVAAKASSPVLGNQAAGEKPKKKKRKRGKAT